MAEYLDVCRYFPTAGGTTDWTFSAAVLGYQSPTAAGVVNSTVYRYRAESSDLSQWEIGFGAYNTGTGVLARTTVLFNSSGGTSKINFTGVPQVAIVALAEDVPSLTKASNTFTGDMAISGLANVGNFSSSSDIVNAAPSSTNNGFKQAASITIGASTNGVCAPATTNGLILVSDVSVNGKNALFAIGSSTVTLISGTAGHLWTNTTTPAASNFGLAWDGTNFRIYNGFASIVNFRAMSLSVA